jgi:hypothetical protein
MTPVQAIRAKCLDCMGGSPAEVRRCPCEDCTLFPFRMGHNPNRAGTGSRSGNFAKNPGLPGDSEREGVRE